MSTTTQATKAALVAAYRARLEASDMAWVSEPGKLDRFLRSVRDTLTPGRTATFHRGGGCWRAALADVGLSASTSLRALRALADGEGWA